ncbi:MAG: PfkB family carbohydrate kinase [Acidimicrobiia bacterium]
MADSPDLAIFSPALVLLIELECDAEENIEVHLHPGGQGYWVGRMASALGARPVLCAPVGGESGTVVSDLLGRDKVALRSVPMKSDNGTFIHDRRGGERQVILEADPPALGRHVLDQLFSVTLAAALEAGVCVVAGTQARTLVPPHTYERLVADLVETGVLVVADLAGELLLPALAGRPHILKVSHEELLADGFARDDSHAEIARAIDELQKAGARNVVVSRAAEPALAAIDGELVEVVVPQLQVVDHRGAGDSMTAGLAVGMVRGLSPRDGLALAAASGALNVTRHGLATGHAATIEQLAQRVEVRAISEPGR